MSGDESISRRRPPSTTATDTPTKKPRLDEQSALFTDEELNVWLNDEKLLQTLEFFPNLAIRLSTLLMTIDDKKPGTLKRYASQEVAERLLKDHPYLNDLLRKGDYKAVLLSDAFRTPTNTTMTKARESQYYTTGALG
ncbi:hypothetical protein C8Q74DRAFT_301233 [Fomes fomentarius]|nr:hypothetical protein C8Q74DRAFT_301233 [Fomes fomentarius]